MTVDLPFLAAVALAGLAYLLGAAIVPRVPLLNRCFFPEPLLGGLMTALGILLLRSVGLRVAFPTEGYPVDFLVALLSTNMGLHITPRVFLKGYKLFPLFLGAGVVLYFVQLVLVLPIALMGFWPLRTAILTGPLSLVGAPFNLNPPSQIAPVAALFRPAFENVEALAQGVMMVGVLAGACLTGLMGRRLFERAGKEPPVPSPAERKESLPLGAFAVQETALIVLILAIVATAFSTQGLLLDTLPWLKQDYLPVIVLAYLFGAGFRLSFEAFFGGARFPEQSLTVLLLGPTMGIVLTYAIMSVPLHTLGLLTAPMVGGALLAICSSVLVAWLAFPVFSRFTDRYYAAVVATVFLAVTTGWGPVAMSYLRRFTDEEGKVEPMPDILPLNAFFLFPWTAIVLTTLLIRLFG